MQSLYPPQQSGIPVAGARLDSFSNLGGCPAFVVLGIASTFKKKPAHTPSSPTNPSEFKEVGLVSQSSVFK